MLNMQEIVVSEFLPLSRVMEGSGPDDLLQV